MKKKNSFPHSLNIVMDIVMSSLLYPAVSYSIFSAFQSYYTKL